MKSKIFIINLCFFLTLSINYSSTKTNTEYISEKFDQTIISDVLNENKDMLLFFQMHNSQFFYTLTNKDEGHNKELLVTAYQDNFLGQMYNVLKSVDGFNDESWFNGCVVFCNDYLIKFSDDLGIAINNFEESTLKGNINEYDALIALLKNIWLMASCVSDKINLIEKYTKVCTDGGILPDATSKAYQPIEDFTICDALGQNYGYLADPNYQTIHEPLKTMQSQYINRLVNPAIFDKINEIDIKDILSHEKLFAKYDKKKTYNNFDGVIPKENKVLQDDLFKNFKEAIQLMTTSDYNKIIHMNDKLQELFSAFSSLYFIQTKKLYTQILENIKQIYEIDVLIPSFNFINNFFSSDESVKIAVESLYKKHSINHCNAVSKYLNYILETNDNLGDTENKRLKGLVNIEKSTTIEITAINQSYNAMLKILCPDNVDTQIKDLETKIDTITKELIIEMKKQPVPIPNPTNPPAQNPPIPSPQQPAPNPGKPPVQPPVPGTPPVADDQQQTSDKTVNNKDTNNGDNTDEAANNKLKFQEKNEKTQDNKKVWSTEKKTTAGFGGTLLVLTGVKIAKDAYNKKNKKKIPKVPIEYSEYGAAAA